MVTPLAYFDLIETFPESGCVVCNLLARDVDRFLNTLLYEYVNEPGTHSAFRARRGLCNEHAWQLTRYHGSSLGIAILYRAAIDETLKIVQRIPDKMNTSSRLKRWRDVSANAAELADLLESTGECMACKHLAVSEKGYIRVLSQHIDDEQLAQLYSTSDGLCLPHFRQLLRHVHTPEQLHKIVSLQTAIWAKLKADLEEFASKSSHERMHEAMGAEGDSWLRAIECTAGEKGIFSVDPRSTRLSHRRPQK